MIYRCILISILFLISCRQSTLEDFNDESMHNNEIDSISYERIKIKTH